MKKFYWSSFDCFFFIAKVYVNEDSNWIDFKDFQDVKCFKSFAEGYVWAEARCKELNDQFYKGSE